RVELVWEDAARQLGASRWRVFGQLTWPTIGPEVARGAAVVFTLTLVEPGAPLVLGLRRTLAFQIVEAALGSDPAPRAAVLALQALVLSALVWVLLGCRARSRSGLSDRSEATPIARARRAEWPSATIFVGALGTWSVLAWLPAVGLTALALAPGLEDP